MVREESRDSEESRIPGKVGQLLFVYRVDPCQFRGNGQMFRSSLSDIKMRSSGTTSVQRFEQAAVAVDFFSDTNVIGKCSSEIYGKIPESVAIARRRAQKMKQAEGRFMLCWDQGDARDRGVNTSTEGRLY